MNGVMKHFNPSPITHPNPISLPIPLFHLNACSCVLNLESLVEIMNWSSCSSIRLHDQDHINDVTQLITLPPCPTPSLPTPPPPSQHFFLPNACLWDEDVEWTYWPGHLPAASDCMTKITLMVWPSSLPCLPVPPHHSPSPYPYPSITSSSSMPIHKMEKWVGHTALVIF